MKHLCVFLLLTVFLYQLVGVYPVAMWQRHELRRAAEARRRAARPDADLVRITVPRAAPGQAGVQWQEQHEFLYRGQRYDVVRQLIKPDAVIYLCWHDTGEEKLLTGLVSHVREYAYPDAGARKSAKKVFDYLAKLNFLAPAAGSLSRPAGAARPRTYRTYAAALCTVPLAPPFAPPRQPAPTQG